MSPSSLGSGLKEMTETFTNEDNSFTDLHERLLENGAVELQESRSEFVRKYQLPNGKQLLLVSSSLVQYETPEGIFELIDNTLIPLTDDNYSFTNQANSF